MSEFLNSNKGIERGGHLETETKALSVLPNDYLNRFEQTDAFAKLLANRLYEAKQRNPKIKNETVVRAFRETAQYKQALWNFFEGTPLSYSEQIYAHQKFENFKKLLEVYWQKTRSLMLKERLFQGEKDELMELDRQRSVLHGKCAEDLVNIGEAPNLTVARLIIHFLSISQGLDVVDRVRDERRMWATAA